MATLAIQNLCYCALDIRDLIAKIPIILPIMTHARLVSTLSTEICFAGDLCIKSIYGKTLERENAEPDMYQGRDFSRISCQ